MLTLILFDIVKMVAPVKFVEQVQRESSKFVKTLGTPYTMFYWQRGYGIFSVSPKDRDEAERYIRNQEVRAVGNRSAAHDRGESGFVQT